MNRTRTIRRHNRTARFAGRRGAARKQAGFTLVEVLIAGLVLIFGLLAVTGIFATAIGGNGRSRVDSTATMLSQSIIEQITAVLARGGPAAVTDCAQPPNTYLINTDVGGANLSGSGIDFTQSTSGIAASSSTPGYQMDFTVCSGGGEANTVAVYDVRWNVSAITAPGGVNCTASGTNNSTCMVTVAARPKGMSSGRFTFGLPVTFRTFIGPQ